MCHDGLQCAKFAEFLRCLDDDLARQAREKGCPYCAGRLDRACYERKPRGGGPDFGEGYNWRWSFCCAQRECRLRTTPASVRFLGQKIYLGAVVLLSACMQQGLSDARVAQLDLVLEVPRRTLKRWRVWWHEVFVHSAFWQAARARLMPAVDAQRLPLSLFERFADDQFGQQLGRILQFISPLSTRAAHAV